MLDDQHRKNRERKRKRYSEGRADADFGFDFHAAVQFLDAGLYDVHTDSAPRNARCLIFRRETRQEHKVEALRRIQTVRGVSVDKTFFEGLAPKRVRAHAAPVIAYFDHYVIAFLPRHQAHDALFGLARRPAVFRHFNAVINGVANEMNQRIAEIVDHRAIELRVLAFEHEIHVLSEVAGEVARHPGISGTAAHAASASS